MAVLHTQKSDLRWERYKAKTTKTRKILSKNIFGRIARIVQCHSLLSGHCDDGGITLINYLKGLLGSFLTTNMD